MSRNGARSFHEHRSSTFRFICSQLKLETVDLTDWVAHIPAFESLDAVDCDDAPLKIKSLFYS